jgi:hypothetical protein
MTSLNTPGFRGFRLDVRALTAVVLALCLVTVGIVPSPAHAAKAKAAKEQKDPREMEARQAFAAGSYKEALEIYTKLYAEKLHPTYLRNIGRCYQNLGEPERAISSFREYLRKAKDMPAEERSEVEGYIKEMEDLQKKNTAAAAPPVAPAQPLPVAAPPVAPVAPQPTVMVQQPAPAPVSEPTPFYKKAWFWGVVGGVVVVATVGGLWAGGVFSAKANNSCRAPYYCGN